ncbi:hypothetical protein [Microvirga sp. G4-2]|uniref:hypothetical protein n=1 Tax=Microvirga sp. G4-2 TaxID=3434467 RepID=UPI0040445186
MRYEDARRLRGVQSVWLRVKLWLRSVSLKDPPPMADLNHLSDHERRDIGLPEPVRYMDWRTLKDEARL